jgi:hypothetical protein
MKITKELVITGVLANHEENGISFSILPLHNSQGVRERNEKPPFMKLDRHSCKRFGIPMSVDIVDYTLLCVLDTHSPLITDRREAIQDDVCIDSLQEVNTIHPTHGTSDPSHETTERFLTVKTAGNSRDRCPCYSLVIPLTAEEYAELRAEMKEMIVCKVTLSLKDDVGTLTFRGHPTSSPEEDAPLCPDCGQRTFKKGLIHQCLNCGFICR